MTLLSAPFDSFTRPNNTTAYASGQLIANSTTAGSVTPLTFKLWQTNQGQTILQRARVFKSGTTATNATFRLHLYQASPTCANGDGGALSTNKALDYFGNIDVATLLPFTDGCSNFGAAAAGAEMRMKLSSGTTVYGLLEARAAYTPAANETFTVTLECLDSY